MSIRTEYDLIIVGGGPAGLAAAIEASCNNVKRILIIERDRELGGILQQCIHNGFGLHVFKEELTGPEYAERFIDQLQDTGIEYMLDTMVLEITRSKSVKAVNSSRGFMHLQAKAIVLSMGCRERTRGAIALPGSRPAGIFNAGTAQRYLNIEGFLVGKKIVILGSGDIGLIMARRMTLEGATVLAVAELMPFSSGLTRNIVQCLQDFDIPLLLSHTVTRIEGKDRVSAVEISEVDDTMQPIPGTARRYECDTLLLSVGLIPENELSHQSGIVLDPVTKGPVVNESMETSVPGIFACGNVVHVHDLVDFVTRESRMAGRHAATYVQSATGTTEGNIIQTRAQNGIAYIVPQKIREMRLDANVSLLMRPKKVFHDVTLVVKADGNEIKRLKKKHMAPGEMENIILERSILAGKGYHDLTVEVCEEKSDMNTLKKDITIMEAS